jgi:hypothetical protein
MPKLPTARRARAAGSAYDPDLPGDDLDYDWLDFDDRDVIDEAVSVDFRALSTGLPARPGTRR